MTEVYIPNVGDTVRIIRSDKCWNSRMDSYVGHIFEIRDMKEVNIGSDRYHSVAKFVVPIDYDDVNYWNWMFDFGHYELLKKKYKPLLKLKINFK